MSCDLIDTSVESLCVVNASALDDSETVRRIFSCEELARFLCEGFHTSTRARLTIRRAIELESLDIYVCSFMNTEP